MHRRSIWTLYLLSSFLVVGVLLLPAGCGGKKKKPSFTDEDKNSSPEDEVSEEARLQHAQWRAEDKKNLKEIGVAFANFSDVYEGFPNAAYCDDTGKPLLSWRVMILPFIEQNNLYKQFKINEPWDGPNNKPLLAQMPKIFANPGRTKPGETTTFYRVIATDKASNTPRPIFVFPSKGFASEISPANIPDGTSNTIVIVEAEEGVPWTKPEALMYEAKGPLPKLSFFYLGVSHALMGDGFVREVKKTVSEKTLRNVITMDDGTPLDRDW